LLGQLTQSLALLSEDIIPKLSDDVETKNGNYLSNNYILGQVETKTKLLKDATENLNTA
jgi:hypothetical protein